MQVQKTAGGRHKKIRNEADLRKEDYLHGYPIAVYGAAGASDARKVLEHYLPRLLKRIREAFPDYIIVLRADSGFNSNALIDTCLKLGAHYIMGFAPIKAAQQAIYSNGLKYAKRKQAKRYTATGTAAQIIGATDWNAKCWKQPRRVLARKRFDRRTCQLDLRLIQTSIACTKDPEKDGYAGELSLTTISVFYSNIERPERPRLVVPQFRGKGELHTHGGINDGLITPMNISHPQDDYRQPLPAGCESSV